MHDPSPLLTVIFRQTWPARLQDLAQTDKRWTIHPKMEEMKAKAKAQGLWNLWISPSLAANIREVVSESKESGLLGAGLSNLVRPIFSDRKYKLQGPIRRKEEYVPPSH